MMDRQEAIDQILDHYHHPRNRRALHTYSFSAEGVNPGCGDVVRMYVQLRGDGRIGDVSFEGEGCTISQAAASIMTEIALGRTFDEIAAMDADTLVDTLGREVVTSRVRCATLPLDALKNGIHQFRGDAAPGTSLDTPRSTQV